MHKSETPPPSRGRGRPKGTGKVDPSSIIDAALDALADGGYRSLTMRGVARTVGVSLATIQHHFPTKDDLWRAAVDELSADAIERRSNVDPRDLAGRLETFLEPGLGRPGLLPALLDDRSPGNQERLAYLVARLADAADEPSKRMQEFEANGVIRAVDQRALFLLTTIGIGAIGGSADATRAIANFDLTTSDGRRRLARGLADIIGLGILPR